MGVGGQIRLIKEDGGDKYGQVRYSTERNKGKESALAALAGDCRIFDGV